MIMESICSRHGGNFQYGYCLGVMHYSMAAEGVLAQSG